MRMHFFLQAVRQQIMELLSPIALHHSTNLLAAVGVVWSDSRRRHKPPKGKVSRTFYKSGTRFTKPFFNDK